MGLLTFKGNHPTLIEAKTAKNYLNEKELRAMGQLVSGYLDFAERQAEREQVMTMNDWAAYINDVRRTVASRFRQCVPRRGYGTRHNGIPKVQATHTQRCRA